MSLRPYLFYIFILFSFASLATAQSVNHKSEIILISSIKDTHNFITLDKDGLCLMWKKPENSDPNKPVYFYQLPTAQLAKYDLINDNLAISSERKVILFPKFFNSVAQNKALEQITLDLPSRIMDLEFYSLDHLLLGAFDASTYRWNFGSIKKAKTKSEKEKLLERYLGPAEPVSSVVKHPIGRVFFSADWAGIINGYQPYDADRLAGKYQTNLSTSPYFTSIPARQRINRIKLTDLVNDESKYRLEKIVFVPPNGDELISVTSESTAEIWKVRGMKTVGITHNLHQGNISSIAASYEYFASAGRDGKVKIYKIKRFTPDELKLKIDRSITHELELLTSYDIAGVKYLYFMPSVNDHKKLIIAGTRSGQVIAINFLASKTQDE